MKHNYSSTSVVFIYIYIFYKYNKNKIKKAIIYMKNLEMLPCQLTEIVSFKYFID